MKRSYTVLLIMPLLALLAGGAPAAAPSKNEKNLEREAVKLDRTASTPKGEQAVLKRIVRDFQVSRDRVASLRQKDLGYGGVVIVLTLVRNMPGGLTDGNIEQVLTLHDGPPETGWDDVARKLGVKLGKVVSQVKKVNNEAHRAMKQAQARPAPASAVSTTPAATEPPAAAPVKNFPGEGRSLPKGRAAD